MALLRQVKKSECGIAQPSSCSTGDNALTMGVPELLPEASISSNKRPWTNDRKTYTSSHPARPTFWYVGPELTLLALDKNQKIIAGAVLVCGGLPYRKTFESRAKTKFRYWAWILLICYLKISDFVGPPKLNRGTYIGLKKFMRALAGLSLSLFIKVQSHLFDPHLPVLNRVERHMSRNVIYIKLTCLFVKLQAKPLD